MFMPLCSQGNSCYLIHQSPDQDKLHTEDENMDVQMFYTEQLLKGKFLVAVFCIKPLKVSDELKDLKVFMVERLFYKIPES